jgi:uncharacterized protein YndB with AHSA1/START domain
METRSKTSIIVQNSINSKLEKVWNAWITPADIEKWNFASDDWQTVNAKNDLRAGGKFSSRMEAKDGSFGFDFEGIYDKVIEHERIEYTLGDARKVIITFKSKDDHTEIVEQFEAENENPVEMQQAGWQAILDNFKKYVESTMI